MIRGTVREHASNAAIAHTRVLLEGLHFVNINETNTDDNGNFEFRGLGRGVYFVYVKADGYVGASDPTRACNPASCRKVDLTVSTSDFVSFVLDRVPSATPNLPPSGPAGTLSVQDAAAPERAQREYESGVRDLESGRVKPAIAHFQKAINAYPAYASAHLRLGTTYADQGRWSEAADALRKSVGINPKQPLAQLALGSVYLEQNDLVSAEAPLRACVELDPGIPFAHFGLARIALAQNRLEEAETEARKALELKPDFASAYVLLGNVYLRRRDARAAQSAYREYLQREPQGAMADQTRNVLAQLERVLQERR